MFASCGVMLQTFKDVDLKIPNPYRESDAAFGKLHLPKNMREGEPKRGNFHLEQVTLPRFIGLGHDDNTLELVGDIIRALPSGSKVALEMGALPPSSLVREVWPDFDYFWQLADIAEKCGHEVIWLEREDSRFGPERRQWNKRVDEALQGMLDSGWTPKTSFDFSKVLQKVGAVPQEEGWGLASGWRSSVQLRHLLRRSDWKDSDVVIAGLAHIVDFAEITGHQIDTIVGNFPSFDAALETISIIREDSVNRNAKLQKRRAPDEMEGSNVLAL